MIPANKPKYFRYRIFLIVWLLALINYIDRGALSYAATHIIGEYGLERASWGAVLGYFGYGYMVGALFGGMLADRFGPRLVLLAAGIAWSILEIATAWAGDFGLNVLGGSALAGFATVRILFGASEGPAYSIVNKTVANWATARERGFVVGFGLLSTPLGAMLTAPVAVALLSISHDWRTMFYVLGCVGLIVLVFFARIFTNRPEDNPHISTEEIADIRAAHAQTPTIMADEPTPPWWAFFFSKTLVFNTIGYFSFMYVNFLLLTWTPKYLQDNFGFSLSSLWYVGMIPWVGSCVTVLLGGRISDWLLKRTGSIRIARSWMAAICLLATTLCFLLVSQAQSVVAVIALMTIANALNSLPNAIYWAVIIDTAPPSRVGTFSGMMHFFANIASVAAPTLTGYLTVRYGYSSMFVAASVATAIGMIVMLQVRPGARLRSSMKLPQPGIIT